MDVLVFGIIGGGMASFSALKNMSSDNFVTPCYLRLIIGSDTVSTKGQTHCCGFKQDISIYNNTKKYCAAPKHLY